METTELCPSCGAYWDCGHVFDGPSARLTIEPKEVEEWGKAWRQAIDLETLQIDANYPHYRRNLGGDEMW